MYQQTSMHNFFKSVNPKSQSAESSRKKHVNTLTTKPKVSPLKNILKNKKVTKLGKTMKSSNPVTHREVKKSSAILSLSPVKYEVVDVLDSDDETDSKSTIKLLDSSYENQLSVTPTKDKSLKRSNSNSSSDFSPRKKQLNNASSAVIKDEVVDVSDSDDESTPPHVIKRNSSCENEIPITPTKQRSFNLSLSKSGGSPSPRKKQLTNGAREVLKHLKHRVSVRDREKMDIDKLSDMIENLNKSRSGVIPKTCYNLEQYYAGIAKPQIRDNGVDDIPARYDAKEVTIPEDKHVRHFFQLLTDSFCEPRNCGYFSDEELDQIFGIITLSKQAQGLFVRLIKRKYCWRRVMDIKYPDISEDLKPYFDELENQGLITSSKIDSIRYISLSVSDKPEYDNTMLSHFSDTDDMNLETLLWMLTSPEVKELCRQRKLDPKANKETCIKRLLQETSNKPLFPWLESPAAALRRTVVAILKPCVCLPKGVINLVDRIVTLSMPSKDVTTTLSDTFLELTMVEERTMRFPEVPISHDPVFQDREHLFR